VVFFVVFLTKGSENIENIPFFWWLFFLLFANFFSPCIEVKKYAFFLLLYLLCYFVLRFFYCELNGEKMSSLSDVNDKEKMCSVIYSKNDSKNQRKIIH
jgi:hypothetical protein